MYKFALSTFVEISGSFLNRQLAALQKRVPQRTALASIVLLFGSAGISLPAHAEGLKVIELFTSQSCYSCPAADELIAKLAEKDENILNLEFHVDYWNQLQYRDAGNWEDPYSKAAYTKRQRTYSALGLKGRNGIYTPQAVVNGTYGAVGSSANPIKRRLKKSSALPVAVDIAQQDADNLEVSVTLDEAVVANVYLVKYLKKITTEITAGENHAKTMDNFNVVTSVTELGELGADPVSKMTVAYAKKPNQGCAILVQNPNLGPILGAARCP